MINNIINKTVSEIIDKSIINKLFFRGVLLFLSLALYSAIVLGATASLDVSYTGALGITNVATANDNITFNVRVNLPASLDSSLDTGQVQYSFGGRSVPIPCAGVSLGVYECSFLFSLRNQRSNLNINVLLFKDGFIGDVNRIHASKSVTIFVDYTSPVVDRLIPSRKGSQINISFRAVDGGGDCSTIKSSGVKSVEFRLGTPDGAIIDTVPGLEGICSLSSEFLYTPNSQGDLRICAIAEDFAGLRSAPKCAPVAFDSTPPIIGDFNLVKFSDDSSLLQYVRSRDKTSAIIKGFVIGSDTSIIKIDATKIIGSGSPLIVMSNLRPNSNNITNISSTVQVSPGTINDCSFIVTAIDSSGNEQSQTFSCGPLNVDDQGPTVSNLPQSGRAFKIFDSFTADFADPSSVNVGSIVAFIGSVETPKTRCDNELAGVTRCYWDNVMFSRGASKITIPRTVSDGYDNTLDSDVIIDIEVVGGSPGISSTSLQFEDSGDNIIPDRELVRGGRARFTFRVENISGIPKANFSIIGISSLVDANVCIDDVDGFKNCTFIPTIERDGPYSGVVQFIFSDRAGNTVINNRTLAVSGVHSGVSDFWKVSSVTCTPSIIDRFSASIKEYPVRCKVDLSPKISGSFTTSTIRLHPDYASKCSNINIVDDSDIDVMNGITGTTTPFLRFNLAKSVTGEPQKNLTCPIQIFSVVTNSSGKYFSEIPEEENVTMVLRFGGGTVDDKFSKYYGEMDDAIDDAEKINSWIGDTKKWLGTVESICGFKQQLTNTKIVLETATGLIGGIAETIRPIDGGSLDSFYDFGACPTTESSTKLLEKLGIGGGGDGKGLLSEIGSYVDKACAVVTCKGSAENLPWYYGGGTADIGGIASGMDSVRNRAQSIAEIFSPKDPNKKFDTFGTDADIKNSIILSAVRLCIPGIIHNLDKYNQIQCEYARCLVEDVPRKNQPSRVCRMAKQSATCSLVIGEAYSILPLRVWDDLMNKITKLFYAPGPVFIQQAVGKLCSTSCEQAKTGPGWNFVRFSCASVSLWSESKNVIEEWSSKNKFKDWWSSGSSSCDNLDEVKKKLAVLKS
ncbi:hypothetical protein HY483_02340 [Candidatus Woesearchaeota archaeon]|nr:hypothetical protein [Candidatus Woesearchaeota archaeon]